jgi:hypothetical protein
MMPPWWSGRLSRHSCEPNPTGTLQRIQNKTNLKKGALVERLKAHLRRLDLKLGLLANFYDTRLAIMPVRIE